MLIDGSKSGKPYTHPLTYSAFTPWLGEAVRINDLVPKTEILKGLSPKDQATTSGTASAIDEDTILRVLDSRPLNWYVKTILQEMHPGIFCVMVILQLKKQVDGVLDSTKPPDKVGKDVYAEDAFVVSTWHALFRKTRCRVSLMTQDPKISPPFPCVETGAVVLKYLYNR
ncbi:hypothetical protein PFLUV_G00028200 [Perca fluviatilis]|uniref:Uncharacterized protein n=1 Tax=Perca fluviatilis TaxID=8168 RepID=A0A6A5FB49_PERFL|nr:hypothetical protein PFLUV_G00028200 [Perca fluviatilis]